MLALLLFLVPFVSGLTIQGRVVNNQQPAISYLTGTSQFQYNYNAAYLPIFVNGRAMDGLLVRVQDLSNSSDPYSVGPSKIAVTVRQGPFNPNHFSYSMVTQSHVILQPSSPEDSEGIEDPRLAYDEKTNTYYLMYTAVAKNSEGGVNAYLSLATCHSDPTRAESWTRRGYLFPDLKWSKSGALLIRDQGPSFLFYGDSSLVPGIQVATTNDLLHYTYNSSVWLPVRPSSWDSLLVEAGPMPLPLSDGNYLFLYNSARKGFPSPKPNWDVQYNVGWVILDHNNPIVILQRSESPLFSPSLQWETGVGASVLGLTPNVVFLEGWQRYPGSDSNDHFIAYLGGADSVVGVAEIIVKIDGNKYFVDAKYH
eukprot:TRINITY_DN13453_c0_g1_i1.p1 TRINITY_DN13453_c0_g1~~TRINITY_DN13453_c0_g1_i1.p1  ORF type:complete len:367 (+),score=45.69 TRINITY_DN13453_c0_g1_i1:35-1135(+)